MEKQVIVYCTAHEYALNRLAATLPPEGLTRYFRHVYHFQQDGADCFLFGYGCLVCWDLSEAGQQKLLHALKTIEIESLSKVEKDIFHYNYGMPGIVQDQLMLAQPHDLMHKLTFSYALAQSVKLASFEERVAKTIEETSHVAQNLASAGVIPLSRKAISQMIGKLFLERSSIYLRNEITETPEFFWENANLEPLYAAAAKYLEITQRANVLNHQLRILYELFEMLGDQLDHRQAYRLEWTIIILITVEVAISLLKDVFRVF